MRKREKLIALTAVVFVMCWLSTVAHSQAPPITTPPPSVGQMGGACCLGGQPDVKEGQPCTILHQVGPRENLHILSAYYYGDPRGWRRIYNLNRDKIRNPNIIYQGQILFIEVPPCWTPRYSFDEFMMLEEQRRQAIGKPGKKKAPVVEEEQILERKKVRIETGPEEGPPSQEGEAGRTSPRVRIRTGEERRRERVPERRTEREGEREAPTPRREGG